VNAHTLSDFRVQHLDALEGLLHTVVARMRAAGRVGGEVVAQDGMRVRASAGSASFHRQATLEKHLAQAQADLLTAATRAAEQERPDRHLAAHWRHARERVARLEAALQEELPLVVAVKKTESKRAQARASETDPEARVMKMANGGYNPAYNFEYATDSWYGVIVGWAVTNQGSDRDAAAPMIDQVKARAGKLPTYWLVDGGFVNTEVFACYEQQVIILAPVRAPRDKTRDRYQVLKSDSPAKAAWRTRMTTVQAKVVYKLRGALAEWVNAQARLHGVQQVTVRGLAKVRALLLWNALAHNLRIWIAQEQRPTAPNTLATWGMAEGVVLA
jgi:exonuclease VII large subunit